MEPANLRGAQLSFTRCFLKAAVSEQGMVAQSSYVLVSNVFKSMQEQAPPYLDTLDAAEQRAYARGKNKPKYWKTIREMMFPLLKAHQAAMTAEQYKALGRHFFRDVKGVLLK
jgi:hypothetical protein